MRTLIALILMACTLSFAHEGEDHGDPDKPSAIENGKLLARDKVTYLDAGAHIQWAGQKLKRKITNTNQVIYQYKGEVKEENKTTDTTSNSQNSYFELKIPGGEALKAFSFDHAGESHDSIEILTPDFSETIAISKLRDFKLSWKAGQNAELPPAMIKIIIEVISASGSLRGRLTVSTNDDGEFEISTKLLSQLPEGSAKIAIKRIWLGGCHPFSDKNEMLGIKTAVSIVGKAKIAAN